MANFLSGGSQGRVHQPPVSPAALRIQTAVAGTPIPFVHGQQRIADNVIWYNNFIATPQSQSSSGGKGGIGGGGGGKGTSGTQGYTYSVSVVLAISEGPVDAILTLWNNKTPYALTGTGYSWPTFAGAQGQAPWGYLAGSYPNQSIGYSSLAYAVQSNWQLGDSPDIPNVNWEVRGAISGAVTETFVISAPYTVTPQYFSLASSVTEYVTVPVSAPYTVQAANPGANNAMPVLLHAITPQTTAGSASSGVLYAGTRVPLAHVSANPGKGQYAVTTGVGTTTDAGGLYTFSAADAGAQLVIIDLAIGPSVHYALQPTGNTVAGSRTVSGLSSTAGLVTGQIVTGAGIPPGTVVTAIAGTSLILSQAATTTASGVTLTAYGAALSQVLGAPAQGQFSLSVAAGAYGVYSFSAADAGRTVVIMDVPDADPAASLVDFLTNPRYGCGFPAGNIGSLTALQNYAYANGLFISPAIVASQAANAYLKDFSSGLNGEFVWSGGLLTFVPYGDTSATGNGHTYSPPSVIYSLGDDDYLHNQSTGSVGVSSFTSDDPVTCVRKRPSDAYNSLKLEFLDRGSSYNPAIVEAKDDAAISLFGLRPADTKQLHFFCIESAAMTSAQLQLGRQQIRNQYSFTVPWYFIQLDPMDVIEVTDAALGLNAQTVRIVEITENQEDWSLSITAEDYLAGSGSAPLYGTQPKAGHTPALNAPPSATVAPVIFQPPVQLASNSGLETWLLTGGAGNYGGCDIYVSSDGNTYRWLGRQTGTSRVGATTADFPAGPDPDRTDTLAVDLSGSASSLLSGTQSDADLGHTLCYVGGYPVPPAPLLGSTTGGSLGATNYVARATYVFATGEGPASAEESLAVVAGSLLTVAAPPAQSGATGWNIYVGEASGGESLQNTSPLPLGASWSEPATGLVAGATAPPSAAGYELLSYETATLTVQYNYTLGTYLRRGQYGSRITDHPAGSLFARLDGSAFAIPYDKGEIGSTLYVKLTPFNIWGGGEVGLEEVQPYTHVIEGPPLPGQVLNFAATQSGDAVLLSWSDVLSGTIKGYDIAYGPVGGSMAVAFTSGLITEASRATSETTISIPPGNWIVYIRAHDIADQVGPVSSIAVTVTNTNTPVLDQSYGPDWLGVRSGFILHYTGVLYPDSTKLAGNHTMAQLFETFGPFPVANPAYTTPVNDTTFNDLLHVFYSLTAIDGPGVSGSPVLTFGLDTWQSGQTDPGSYPTWTVGNAFCRYLKGQIVENIGVPAVVMQLTITASVPSQVTETVQGFSISNSAGTTLTYASYGIGPFHSDPSVIGTSTDGVLQSVGVSNITTTQCTVQGFVSGVPSTGTCNLAFTGE